MNATQTPVATAPVYGEPLDLTVLSPREQAFGNFIDRVIIGQPRGKAAAKRAFRRTQSKLRMGSAPFYAILALGPTTCGKSELAYRLGEYFHGNREAVLKIDGSEYMDDSRLTALIGGTAQWVGFVDKNRPDYTPPREDEKDTMCTLNNHNLKWSRKGSKSPVTIVLVDEWDKACLEFNNIMLSILRDGKYTLGNGEVVDFSNCIFVFTANLGARDVEQAKEKAENPLGFRPGEKLSDAEAESLFTKHLKQFTAPEFRARITENGEIVIFDALSDEQVGMVRDLKVDEMTAFIAKQVEVTLTVDEGARKALLSMALADGGTVAKLNGVLKTHITDNVDSQLVIKSIAAKDNVLVTVASDEKTLVMRREVKPLLLVGADSDEYRQATAEADAAFAAAREGKGGAADDKVDEAALRQAMENGKSEAAQQPKARQPFIVTLVTNSDEELEQARRDLTRVFANLGIIKRGENTQYGIAIQVPMGIVQGNLTEVTVSADLRDMVSLKEAAPMLGIRTVEVQL